MDAQDCQVNSPNLFGISAHRQYRYSETLMTSNSFASPRTIRCMVRRKGASFTATTGTIAICRSTSCGDHVLCARLQPGNSDAAAGVEEEVERPVAQLRAVRPDVLIVLRAGSGFCRDALLTWCEAHRVAYVIGLAKNFATPRFPMHDPRHPEAAPTRPGCRPPVLRASAGSHW